MVLDRAVLLATVSPMNKTELAFQAYSHLFHSKKLKRGRCFTDIASRDGTGESRVVSAENSASLWDHLFLAHLEKISCVASTTFHNSFYISLQGAKYYNVSRQQWTCRQLSRP